MLVEYVEDNVVRNVKRAAKKIGSNTGILRKEALMPDVRSFRPYRLFRLSVSQKKFQKEINDLIYR